MRFVLCNFVGCVMFLVIVFIWCWFCVDVLMISFVFGSLWIWWLWCVLWLLLLMMFCLINFCVRFCRILLWWFVIMLLLMSLVIVVSVLLIVILNFWWRCIVCLGVIWKCLFVWLRLWIVLCFGLMSLFINILRNVLICCCYCNRCWRSWFGRVWLNVILKVCYWRFGVILSMNCGWLRSLNMCFIFLWWIVLWGLCG